MKLLRLKFEEVRKLKKMSKEKKEPLKGYNNKLKYPQMEVDINVLCAVGQLRNYKLIYRDKEEEKR